MCRQIGSEIDEFVTDVLRNQLLGIPLDLAAINLARGRDVGTPSLNEAREKFFAATGDTLLKPYTSWADFALNLKNPASIINFIAAYGTHDADQRRRPIPSRASKRATRDRCWSWAGQGAPDDRLDFLNATGAYAGEPGRPQHFDFWIGGLAEKKMAFGGMLGSTFCFVFQMTMENLQDADRFYYLSRVQGLNLLNELENNTFAEIVMRNTDLGDTGSTALPGNIFSRFEMPSLEMDISKQLDADPTRTIRLPGRLLRAGRARRCRTATGLPSLSASTATSTSSSAARRATTSSWPAAATTPSGARAATTRIEGGYGVDQVFGGEGDDIITNAGTDIGEADFLHGNEGNDVIHGGSGLSLIFGNQGQDFIITGPDGKEAFGGTGNDFILGGTGAISCWATRVTTGWRAVSASTPWRARTRSCSSTPPSSATTS